jgi:hypothetical protein
MKSALLSVLTLACSLLWMPGAAEAHHGWAAFEPNTEVTFKATVTDFHFVNPHSVVEFEVKDDKGQIHKWEGEMTSPIHLAPKGWTAATLKAGDEITITGHPARNGSLSMRVMKILQSNGKELKVDYGVR